MTLTTFDTYADAITAGATLPESVTLAYGTEVSPYEVLRASTPLEELRAKGTFFTGNAMAHELWGDSLNSLADGAVIVDPACGAGDLLLPAAAQIFAGEVTFRACDIRESFTRVAAARLASSMTSTLAGTIETRVADFSIDPTSVSDASVVVLNPPFVAMNVNEPWASGKINAAAWFALTAVEKMPAGSRLLAVLPDVLRSGSRYERWRGEMSARGKITGIKLLGQFDDHTDVDVFRLELEVGGQGSSDTWLSTALAPQTIDDRFDIRVGPVVPHRDPHKGPLSEFVTARSLSGGERLTRAFHGRLEEGPMVLIGRTSRPGQQPRVRAKVRATTTPTAIENHLLIAKPMDGLESSCHELVALLQSPETVSFLDNRIRCRHLTVRAVKEIPWIDDLKT